MRVNVPLEGEVADKFKRIKSYLNIQNDTEVVRLLIKWYFDNHDKELTGPPKLMWHMNLSDNGVRIWDPDLKESVFIKFTPKGILCEHCEINNCKHIQFSFSIDEIKATMRRKRKEGWKLPEV